MERRNDGSLDLDLAGISGRKALWDNRDNLTVRNRGGAQHNVLKERAGKGSDFCRNRCGGYKNQIIDADAMRRNGFGQGTKISRDLLREVRFPTKCWLQIL